MADSDGEGIGGVAGSESDRDAEDASPFAGPDVFCAAVTDTADLMERGEYSATSSPAEAAASMRRRAPGRVSRRTSRCGVEDIFDGDAVGRCWEMSSCRPMEIRDRRAGMGSRGETLMAPQTMQTRRSLFRSSRAVRRHRSRIFGAAVDAEDAHKGSVAELSALSLSSQRDNLVTFEPIEANIRAACIRSQGKLVPVLENQMRRRQ